MQYNIDGGCILYVVQYIVAFFMTMLLYYNQFIILTTRAFKFIYAHLESGFFSSCAWPFCILFNNMLATLSHQKTNA